MRGFLVGFVLCLILGFVGCQNDININSSKKPNGAVIETRSYTCPMHPHYISTDENGACPICGMDLVPLKGSSDSLETYISVSPEMIQSMGIKTATVTLTGFGGNIRAFGQIEPNTRLETVTTSRLEGWIENLTVKAEGDSVKRGDVLYKIYSPDLIGAQKDFLASLQIGNVNRIASVKKRLQSIGLQDSSIKRLTQTQTLIERVPVYAESSGLVSELNIREGDFVKSGAPIMRLQSYKTVWVMASVPEADLPQVKTGQPVSLSFEGAIEAPNSGVIDYIYPTIDKKSRTAKVRVVVENLDNMLRPGAYVDMSIARGEGVKDRLSVPTQAVLRNAQGTQIVVDLGDGTFESRAVKIGEVSQGRTEIISGLVLGEHVVSSGQFLLDSESNLREGLSKLSALRSGFDGDTPLSDLPINAQTLGQIDHLVDAALYFHEALIDGYAVDPNFLDPILQIAERVERSFAGSKLEPIVQDAKAAIRRAKSGREGEALAVILFDLLKAIEPWLMEGAPTHYKSKGLILYQDRDALWLQEGGLPANPYGRTGGRAKLWPDTMSGTE